MTMRSNLDFARRLVPVGICAVFAYASAHALARVYALDLPPGALPAGLKRDAFLAAIKDHVLAATSTVLRYGR